MYDSQTIALAALAAAVLGFLIGALTNRRGSSGEQAKTEQELAAVKEEQEIFQGKVDEHFEKTGALLNQMAESYREIHKHLAEGAQSLTGNEFTEVKALNSDSDVLEGEKQEQVEQIEQPKDYAPRDPESKGALHEEFDLDKPEQEKAPEEPVRTPV